MDNVIFNDEARVFLVKGADVVARAVASTMGPKGRPVAIKYNTGQYVITQDGVTAAKAVNAKENNFTMLGSQMLKDVAIKTNEDSGDGTSTSIVIAKGILDAIETLKPSGNIINITDDIKKTSIEIIKRLNDSARQIKGVNDIKDVATISANGDEEIGTIIADTINKIGIDGSVDIDKSKSDLTYSDTVEGMTLDRGYVSNMFINDNIKRRVVLNNPVILMANQIIKSNSEVVSILEQVVAANRSILVVVKETEVEALNSFILNKTQGGIDIAVIQAPGHDSNRDELFHDLSIFSGGKYLPEETDLTVSDIPLSDFGSAEKVIVTSTTTTIFKGNSDEKQIKDRVEELKERIKGTEDKFIKEKLQERVSKLIGGIAVIYVGGKTPAEQKERYDRVEDAVNATKCAIEEGVIPGGGISLFNINKELKDSKDFQSEGAKILLEAIKKPIETIIKNTGKDSNKIIATLSNEEDNMYDAKNDTFVNLHSNIIDPVKITKAALESAVSISILLLTTSCVILE